MLDFSVVFLTKNRLDIVNSLKSLIAIKNYGINLKIIIIDGNKDNRVDNIVSNNFSNHLNNFQIIKQKKSGFMRGCFEGIEYIKTSFFTFMYDDDILSPYYGDLLKKSLIDNKIFFSYGIVKDVKKDFTFTEIQKIDYSENYKLINKYFTLINFFSKIMPNSPICSIFRTSILKEWKKIILKNCLNNKRNFYYLLKKNIGPDLLLYLVSLALEKDKIIVNDSYMAKFTSHKDSMSIKYGNVNLKTGYLITKSIFINYYKSKFTQKIIKKFQRYLKIKYLYIYALKKIMLNNSKKNNFNPRYI
jgi:hypothetical protein